MYSRISFVGISTTGKSYLANTLKKEKAFADYEIIDSDSWVAENILGDNKKPGIARVFLKFGRKEALKLIEEYEPRFLEEYQYIPKNTKKYIFALGPWVAIRENWDIFRKDLLCIWLKKDVGEIHEGLTKRWKKIKNQFHENFPEYDRHPKFGCWDIGVIVDENLKFLPRNKSLENLSRLNQEMGKYYNNYPSIDTTKSDVSPELIINVIAKYKMLTNFMHLPAKFR